MAARRGCADPLLVIGNDAGALVESRLKRRASITMSDASTPHRFAFILVDHQGHRTQLGIDPGRHPDRDSPPSQAGGFRLDAVTARRVDGRTGCPDGRRAGGATSTLRLSRRAPPQTVDVITPPPFLITRNIGLARTCTIVAEFGRGRDCDAGLLRSAVE